MQLKVFWLPYYMNFHHKIKQESWLIIILLKYEAYRGTAMAQEIPPKILAKKCGSLTHSLLPSHLKMPLNFDDNSICIHVASPFSWAWIEWKAYDFIWKEFWARRQWTKVLIAALVRELLPHSGLFPNVYFRDLVGESSTWSKDQLYPNHLGLCLYRHILGFPEDFLNQSMMAWDKETTTGNKLTRWWLYVLKCNNYKHRTKLTAEMPHRYLPSTIFQWLWI